MCGGGRGRIELPFNEMVLPALCTKGTILLEFLVEETYEQVARGRIHESTYRIFLCIEGGPRFPEFGLGGISPQGNCIIEKI